MDGQTGEIGYIYILARKSGKIVKVGETSRDPSKRRKEYVAEYKLVDFDLFREFKVPLNARKDIEKLAHRKLQHLRLSLLEKGGAREIFECDTATAVKAIEEATAESEVNRIELEKQRLQQIKKNKLAKAKAKYDAQLEVFTENWLREWEASKWVNSKRSSLDAFVAGNSFEKQVKEREGWDYVAAAYGVGFHIVGVVCLYYLILGESPSDNGGSIIFNLSFFLGGFLCLKVKSTITVPDQEALAKKAALEEEIKTNKQTTIANARNDFEKNFTLENFYD